MKSQWLAPLRASAWGSRDVSGRLRRAFSGGVVEDQRNRSWKPYLTFPPKKNHESDIIRWSDGPCSSFDHLPLRMKDDAPHLVHLLVRSPSWPQQLDSEKLIFRSLDEFHSLTFQDQADLAL